MNVSTYNTPGTTLYNLKRRFYNMTAREKTDWESLDAFANWALENGYFNNAFLRKKDKSLPFGPDNAYFSAAPEVYPNQHREAAVNESPFCQGCTRTKHPETCGGCKEWEDWYVKNWNQHFWRGAKTGGHTQQESDSDGCVRLSECDGVDEDCPRRKR